MAALGLPTSFAMYKGAGTLASLDYSDSSDEDEAASAAVEDEEERRWKLEELKSNPNYGYGARVCEACVEGFYSVAEFTYHLEDHVVCMWADQGCRAVGTHAFMDAHINTHLLGPGNTRAIVAKSYRAQRAARFPTKMKKELSKEIENKKVERRELLSEQQRGIMRKRKERKHKVKEDNQSKTTNKGSGKHQEKSNENCVNLPKRFYMQSFENDVIWSPIKKFKGVPSYADDTYDEVDFSTSKDALAKSTLNKSLTEDKGNPMDFLIEDSDEDEAVTSPNEPPRTNISAQASVLSSATGAMGLLTSYGSDSECGSDVEEENSSSAVAVAGGGGGRESIGLLDLGAVDRNVSDSIGVLRVADQCAESVAVAKSVLNDGSKPVVLADLTSVVGDAASVGTNGSRTRKSRRQSRGKKNKMEEGEATPNTHPSSISETNQDAQGLKALSRRDKVWTSSKTSIRDIQVEDTSEVDYVVYSKEFHENKMAAGFAKKKVREFRQAYSESLLEKILSPQIIEERNILLQCTKFIVDNNFFEVPSQPSSSGVKSSADITDLKGDF